MPSLLLSRDIDYVRLRAEVERVRARVSGWCRDQRTGRESPSFWESSGA